MAEREICEGWELRMVQENWLIVSDEGELIEPGDEEVDVTLPTECGGRAEMIVPFEVLAEVLRLSGYDVSKREGT